MKKILTISGRVLFAVPFIVFGLGHLMNGAEMAAWSQTPVFLIYLSGVGMIAAGVSLIIQKLTDIAMALLAILMLIFVVMVHIPGMGNENPMMAQMSFVGLLKDVGLAGGALAFAGAFRKA